MAGVKSLRKKVNCKCPRCEREFTKRLFFADENTECIEVFKLYCGECKRIISNSSFLPYDASVSAGRHYTPGITAN